MVPPWPVLTSSGEGVGEWGSREENRANDPEEVQEEGDELELGACPGT